MKKNNSLSTLHTLLISLLLFVAFFNIYVSIYKEIPIRYWDEQAWIGRGYFFDLMLQGDIKNPLWETFYSYNQPMLGIFLYGAVIYPEYIEYKKTNEANYVQFLIDHHFYEISMPEYNQYKMNSSFIEWGEDPYLTFDVSEKDLISMFGVDIQKTIHLIYRARLANVVLLSAAIVVMFFLTRMIASSVVAMITSITVGLNFLYITAGLRAHAEGLFIFMFLLSLYLFFRFLSQRSYKVSNAILLGLAVSLCTQTKINGVMLLFLTNGIFLLFIIRSLVANNLNTLKLKGKFILVTNTVFLVAFVLLHPYLYPNPLGNIVNEYRYKKLQTQEQILMFPEQHLPSFTSRTQSIFNNFILNPRDHCHYNGFYFSNQKTCDNNLFFYSKLLLFICGIYIFVINALRRHDDIKIMFVASFLFIIIVTSAYLVLDWDRYYVHFIYYFVFFQVFGVVSLIQILTRDNYVTTNTFSLFRQLLSSNKLNSP